MDVHGHVHPAFGQTATVVRRAIIVDDDLSTLGAMESLLAQWGLEVVAFGDFERARAELTSGAPPDVLLVDIRLGMFNGLQLVHLAKQSNAATAVIVVSGFDDPVLCAEAEAAGALFLLKPVDLIALRHHLSVGLPDD